MTKLNEFRKGLWLTELQLEGFDVRGAVIAGSERMVVWDSLSHPRDMYSVYSLVSGSHFDIVYSHADWDHFWGTAGLPDNWGQIIAHDKSLARFKNDVPAKLQEMRAKHPDQWKQVVLVEPTLTFKQELTLYLGGVTLKLKYLPGHTLDCLVGFIPQWGILLAGDTVETPFPVVNDDSPVSQWIASLEHWRDNPELQTVIPAHGPTGGRELLENNISYLRNLLEGRNSDLTDALTDFYKETHEANIKHLADQNPGS